MPMIQIGETIISDEILSEVFTCDLSQCRGMCCVEGDAGAPLEEEEVKVLEEIYPKVKPYLRPQGIAAIEEQGTAVVDETDGDWVTPLVKGKECAYVVFDEKETALCGIEKAYIDGKVNWQKPVSCHLYPVRVKQHNNFISVNYDRWTICSAACDFGKKLKTTVADFCKTALIRRFGNQWYNELMMHKNRPDV